MCVFIKKTNRMIYVKGISFLVFVISVFGVAFWFNKKGKTNNSLIFILLGGFVLRGWCLISDRFLHEWDERYHALVAKNLAENPFFPVLFKNAILEHDYHSWVMSHVWVHKQPVPLWLMAGSIKLFGATDWAVRLPSVLLSIVAIYLTFRIATFFKKEQVGLLAAFFHAINGLVIEIATGREATDHPDSQFLFFIELSVFCILLFLKKKKNTQLIFIGLSLGLAILSKWLPALIVMPIFVLLTIDTEGVKKTILNSIIILVTAMVVVLPWQIYILKAFPNEAAWEFGHHVLHITTVLEGHDGTALRHLLWACMSWNELILIIFVWFLAQLWQHKNNKKEWALVVWIVLPYLFFSFVKTKMIAYTLFVAPAIFTIMAIFWWHFKEKEWSPKWAKTGLLSLLIILSVRYSYERLKLFKDQTKRLAETEWIKNWQVNSQTIVFNAGDRYIEVMFYKDIAAAYPYIPTVEQINDLILRGYKIAFVRNENVPIGLLSRKELQFL